MAERQNAAERLRSAVQRLRGAGKQTPLDILARKLALKEGNSSLVSNLYSQLPADYQTMGNAPVRLQNDPTTVEAFARSVGPTDFTRAATGIAFEPRRGRMWKTRGR